MQCSLYADTNHPHMYYMQITINYFKTNLVENVATFSGHNFITTEQSAEANSARHLEE